MNSILAFFGTHPKLAWTLVFAICSVIAGIVAGWRALDSAPGDR